MKMSRIRFIPFIALIYIILFGQNIFAQNKSKLIFTDSNKTREIVPFKLINNLIIIQLKINGYGPYHFILDSGFSGSVFIEPEDMSRMQLKNSRDIRIKGLGNGETLKAYESTGNTIEISGIVGNDFDFYVLNRNLLDLSSKLGIPINGIIGYPAFRDFIVEIKYNKRQLIFFKTGNFSYKGRYKKYITIPLRINQNKPYIVIMLRDEDGNEASLKTLLDTGASHALWAEEKSLKGLEILYNEEPIFLGSGLNGDVYGRLGRIFEVNTGPFKLNNVIISRPDSISISKTIGINERDGSIGAEILRRYHVVLDYHHQKLSLKKNNHFNQKFTQNKSGLEVSVSFSAPSRYFIYEVRKNSPADIAGLKPGDQIIQINQNPTSGLQLDEIYSFFYGKHGEVIQIRYLRNGKGNIVKLKLKDFI
jgi:predicted aspartyl protease